MVFTWRFFSASSRAVPLRKDEGNRRETGLGEKQTIKMSAFWKTND